MLANKVKGQLDDSLAPRMPHVMSRTVTLTVLSRRCPLAMLPKATPSGVIVVSIARCHC